ncbi:MAG: transporter substrate-binding domain-containing protein [Gammaproteobacteria bacterium]|nr:transporter substrate-binding domain-containing protein [Gammaproteobacteria bacterium]
MTWNLCRIGGFFLVSAISLTGCAPTTEEQTQAGGSAVSNPVLRVGLTANYPPLIDKVDGKLEGIEIDLAREVGKDLGKRMVFVEMPWVELIAALKAGEIDVIMSGMSITAERKKEISFTEPYLEIGQMAITRVDEIQRLGNLSALLSAPITVGFEPATTGESFVKTNMRNAKPQPVASIDAAVTALRNREIDAFVHDAPTAWRIGSDPAYQDLIGLYWPLTDEHLGWGVRIADPALRKVLSDQITVMKKDGRLASITRKWIKVRVEVK